MPGDLDQAYVRHVEGVGDPEFVIAAVVALASDLLDRVGS